MAREGMAREGMETGAVFHTALRPVQYSCGRRGAGRLEGVGPFRGQREARDGVVTRKCGHPEAKVSVGTKRRQSQ